jgi:hypothetical protein
MIKSNRNSDVLVTKVETVYEYDSHGKERKKEKGKKNLKVLFAKK